MAPCLTQTTITFHHHFSSISKVAIAAVIAVAITVAQARADPAADTMRAPGKAAIEQLTRGVARARLP